MNTNALKTFADSLAFWKPPAVGEDIPHGDMPGDKVQIGEDHIAKANTIFPLLVPMAAQIARNGRIVITVCGGSGVGKSEIASLLSHYFRSAGVGSYTLSGDNYPRRIPMYNDAERVRIFRAAGLRGMIDAGLYSQKVKDVMAQLWGKDVDADPMQTAEYPWLAAYQSAGRKALTQYLGTDQEQDYQELSQIIRQFHDGADNIWLKRMGRTEDQRWYEAVDFSDVNVLIIEWTHGNSDLLEGVDIPVLLNSTPEQTRAHRRARSRDGKTDSAFTTMVLEIEQAELNRCAHKAKIIIAKTGEYLTYEQYRREMGEV